MHGTASLLTSVTDCLSACLSVFHSLYNCPRSSAACQDQGVRHRVPCKALTPCCCLQAAILADVPAPGRHTACTQLPLSKQVCLAACLPVCLLSPL
jgi:hypothetical protein